jgi:hypothetical protein
MNLPRGSERSQGAGARDSPLGVGVDPDVELDAIIPTGRGKLLVLVATKRFSSLVAAHDHMVKQALAQRLWDGGSWEGKYQESPAAARL